MAESLIQRLRAHRTSTLELGHITLTVRRPTDLQASRLYQDEASVYDVARDCVIGWSGVTEGDILPGGSDRLIDFDEELWPEWLADRPDFWMPIRDRAMDDYEAHVTEREEAKKNSPPG